MWAVEESGDVSRYYTQEYFDIPAGLDDLRASSQDETFKCEILDDLASRGRLLEIGPSVGKFAVLAADAGYSVDVVEASEQCCRFLQATGRLASVTHSDDPLSTLTSGMRWNVIALWQSLEHLDDAPTVLAAAFGALEPGGHLIVATPDPNSMQSRLLGRRWIHLDAPRHRWLFPRTVLTSMAKEAGLQAISVSDRDRGSRGWNTYGWANSLREVAGRGLAGDLGFHIGRAIALFLAPIERSGGRGASYTAIYRRPQ